VNVKSGFMFSAYRDVISLRARVCVCALVRACVCVCVGGGLRSNATVVRNAAKVNSNESCKGMHELNKIYEKGRQVGVRLLVVDRIGC
jgi:hypothetical protein